MAINRHLLTVDGIINLLLGGILLWYPQPIIDALGLPANGASFFASILGGVVFGIGLALLMERSRRPARCVGLGLGGAIAINLCGGAVLAGWLVRGRLALTPLGVFCLWAIVLLLVGLSVVELVSCVRGAGTTAR